MRRLPAEQHGCQEDLGSKHNPFLLITPSFPQ